MPLTFNSKTGEYVLFTNDRKRAEDVGLTRATSVRGPNGEDVYFSQDGYAALNYIGEADNVVRQRLGMLADEYKASWALESPNVYACGQPGFPHKFRNYQNAGIDYGIAHPHCLLADEMGVGKQIFVNDFNVLTPTGWTDVSLLKLGDLVISQDGTPTRVSGIFPQGKQTRVRMHFRDGTFADSGYEHLWVVRNGNHRARGGSWRVKTTAEIKAVYDAGPSVNSRYEIPVVEPVQFSEKNFPIDPYVLGVLIGDGCLVGSLRPRFSNPDFDSDIAERVSRSTLLRKYAHPTDASACPYYTLIDGDGYRGCIAFLGLNVKSELKFIPEEYKWGSVQQRLDLLRGLMDTDGCSAGNRINFSTMSQRLSDDVAYLVRSLGGIAIQKAYDRAHEDKGLEYRVNVKINICPFYTKRKAASWSPPERGNRVRKFITSVEEIPGEEEAVCIRVEHPSHLYIINDFIVTHNTATSIGVANATGAERILVVCPASIRLNWRREIKLWSTLPQVRCYPVTKSADGIARWPNYTIISFELARNPDVHAALRSMDWDMVIIDEAHFLKSHNAERTRALFGGGKKQSIKEGLLDRTKRVMALTGTPIPNRPRECFTLAHALCWESIDFMSYDEFCYRFNPSARFGNGIREEQGRLPELHARLRCNFMIRRLKKDVVKELPDKQYEFAYIDADGTIKDIIRREKMLDFDPRRDLKDPNAKIWGQISTLRREMGEAKLPRVIEHLKYLMDIEEVPKMVVFSHHRSVMDRLTAAMAEYGVVQYRGGMGDKAKENAVLQFQVNKDIRIFSGQLDAAGFGINGLQNVASLCVFAEPAWVPGANDQAVDRIHRLGQQFPVLAQFLIAEGSLDERVLSAVLDKAHNIHAVLDDAKAT